MTAPFFRCSGRGSRASRLNVFSVAPGAIRIFITHFPPRYSFWEEVPCLDRALPVPSCSCRSSSSFFFLSFFFFGCSAGCCCCCFTDDSLYIRRRPLSHVKRTRVHQEPAGTLLFLLLRRFSATLKRVGFNKFASTYRIYFFASRCGSSARAESSLSFVEIIKYSSRCNNNNLAVEFEGRAVRFRVVEQVDRSRTNSPCSRQEKEAYNIPRLLDQSAFRLLISLREEVTSRRLDSSLPRATFFIRVESRRVFGHA